MEKPKRSDDLVVVWENTKRDGYNSKGLTHFDTDRGGYMMKKDRAAVMEVGEREIRGAPPSHIRERVVTRAEAEKIKKSQEQ